MSPERRRHEVNPLLRLGQLGQSLRYDYIPRGLVASGELARLIGDDGLIAGSRPYDDKTGALASR